MLASVVSGDVQNRTFHDYPSSHITDDLWVRFLYSTYCLVSIERPRLLRVLTPFEAIKCPSRSRANSRRQQVSQSLCRLAKEEGVLLTQSGARFAANKPIPFFIPCRPCDCQRIGARRFGRCRGRSHLWLWSTFAIPNWCRKKVSWGYELLNQPC